MRWNPFVMWWEHRKQRAAVIRLAESIGEDICKLRKEVAEHRLMVAHELHNMKQRPHGNASRPLSMEEEEIAEIMLRNSKMPHEIRQHFASGGPLSRAATGRFGEAPSELLRSTDPVPHATFSELRLAALQAAEIQYPGTPYEALVNVTEIPDLKFSYEGTVPEFQRRIRENIQLGWPITEETPTKE